MKLDSKTISIIAVTLVIAGGAYWYFFTGTGNEAPITVTTSQNLTQSKFKTLVGKLNQISFKTGIFSDARFQSLVDLTTPLVIEPSGRQDPFAVIPGLSAE